MHSRPSAIHVGSLVAFSMLIVARLQALEPIPDKLIVLTFDDSCKSHFTVARQALKKHAFGATFFVTEGLTYRKNPSAYMTWEEIRILHDEGFEIGNHLKDHMAVNSQNTSRLEGQLSYIADRCVEHGIPKPISFAWPANFIHRDALPILDNHGIVWARRGSFPESPPGKHVDIAYDPTHDHPFLIPTASVSRPEYGMEEFKASLALAEPGRISIACFHGVPETEHAWVNTPRELFLEFMTYLDDNDYTVIAMRDLKRYVDPNVRPDDPWAIIEMRRKELSTKSTAE